MICTHGMEKVTVCGICYAMVQEDNRRLRVALILAKAEIEKLSCCQEPFQKSMDMINDALGGK